MGNLDWKRSGAIIASIAVALFAVGWSFVAFTQLGAPVEFATDGKTVELDKWSRASSVFTAVLPLLTTIVGFWVGAQGKEKAEEKAKEAESKADDAQKRAEDAVANEKKLAAAATPEILDRAQQQYGYVINGA